MENTFWLIVMFLCSGLGALIVSSLFGKFKTEVFVSCVLGIPGLLCAFAAIKLIFRILNGFEKLSLENLIGVVGILFLSVVFLTFPITMFKKFKDD
jgi:hypothetical protein